MSSLIQGYNYDIFISYRQKDNKHDGWVKEFMDNLKGELESTFKEEISVYFDINTHDGLLETHDVDESLKDKLKCLIFVPIISRTYCDPKAFAWEHEFKAFVKQATEDQYGLKLKLPNGNVASRVLPVQIHDLQVSDSNLCESVLGGMLRGIEFIYKEPGVNRPLTADDDPKENLNKTRYRNQINKIALAIDEIIRAIKNHGKPFEEMAENTGKAATVSESIDKSEKSLAVLPFINDSPDDANTYFINGIMEEILNNLQKIKNLRVISRTSVEQYRGQKKPIAEIAEELDVNYIVEGSGQKYGNAFRLRAQLIAADRETHLWGESFQQNITGVEDIFNIQIQIAESIAAELEAFVSAEEMQLIEKIPDTELQVYDEYLKALQYLSDCSQESLFKSIDNLKLAIEKDPSWAPLYAALAGVWFTLSTMGGESPEVAIPLVYENLNKALELDPELAEAHYVNASLTMGIERDWGKAEKEFLQAIAINPNHSLARMHYSHLLYALQRSEEAALQSEIGYKLDSLNPLITSTYAMALICKWDCATAISVLENLLAKDPENFAAKRVITGAAFQCGDFNRLIEATIHTLQSYKVGFTDAFDDEELDNIKKIYNENGFNPAYTEIVRKLEILYEKGIIVPTDIAFGYYVINQDDKAMKWIEKGYEMHDANVLYLGTGLYSFTRLYRNPRFIEVLNKLNLPLPKSD